MAASRVTSLSPAKAEITGFPFNIRFTWKTEKFLLVLADEETSSGAFQLNTEQLLAFTLITQLSAR